jgi:hypothetical protein
MGMHKIWMVGVSDSGHMQHAMVFESLNECLLTSPFENAVTNQIPFTIVLYKGYRIVTDAFNAGGHFVLQPIFSCSNWQLTTVETLISSTVATDCTGNERAVQYMKISEYLSK